MKPLLPKDLLFRYTSGHATPEEREQVERWYASFEEGETPLDTMDASEKEELEETLLRRIRGTEEQPVKRSFFRRNWFRAVATLALLGAVAGTWFALTREPAQERVLAFANTQKIPVRAVLEDSSVVWLHPGAELNLDPAFGGNTRLVRLKGMAFFEVKRDEKRPFVILARGLRTQVLGTSFTVDATPTHREVSVTVLTGKVKVQDEQSHEYMILLPKQKARFKREEHVFQVTETPKNDLSNVWKSESVDFEDASVREICRVLGKRYGVKFEAENDQVFNCQLTANFSDHNLPTMLEMLSRSLPLTYEMHEKTILLKGKGCTP
jgi:transmembrane sensor